MPPEQQEFGKLGLSVKDASFASSECCEALRIAIEEFSDQQKEKFEITAAHTGEWQGLEEAQNALRRAEANVSEKSKRRGRAELDGCGDKTLQAEQAKLDRAHARVQELQIKQEDFPQLSTLWQRIINEPDLGSDVETIKKRDQEGINLAFEELKNRLREG